MLSKKKFDFLVDTYIINSIKYYIFIINFLIFREKETNKLSENDRIDQSEQIKITTDKIICKDEGKTISAKLTDEVIDASTSKNSLSTKLSVLERKKVNKTAGKKKNELSRDNSIASRNKRQKKNLSDFIS